MMTNGYARPLTGNYFGVKYQSAEPMGWGPRLRLKFGYFNPG